MAAPVTECPADEQLQAFLGGQNSADTQQHVAEHIDLCSDCQHRLGELVSGPDWQRLANSKPSPAAAATGRVANDRTIPQPIADPAESPPQIPGFEVLAKVGSGGMASVYQARQVRVNRIVALKLLTGNFATQPERLLRFRREAEAVGRLQHPAIVPVFEYGEYEGQPFIVQEFADGGTLESKTDAVPQSAAQTADWAIEITDAVRHAHEQGVLHRDIKPSNIMFAGDQVRLGDFGLAKFVDVEDELTQTEAVFGTPAYMSPEQSLGLQHEIAPTTDVFSLGVVLYELLTGISPFRAGTPVESLRLVQEHQPVAPRQLQPAVPRDLNTICMKCLEKDPAARYDGANSLLEDLERFRDGLPILARPPGALLRLWKLTRRHPAIAALTCCLLATIVVLLNMWVQFTSSLQTQTTIAQNKTRQTQAALDAQQQTTAAGQAVLKFLTEDLLQSVLVQHLGVNARIVDVLAAADESLGNQFSGEPRIEADIRATVGSMYFELREPLKALPHLERAIALYRLLQANPLNMFILDHDHINDTRFALAHTYKMLRRYDDALAEVDSMLAMKEGDIPDERRFNLRRLRIGILMASDRQKSVLADLQSLLAEADDRFGRDHEVSLRILGLIGVACHNAGNTQEAIRIHRQEIELAKKVLGPKDSGTLASMNNLAVRLAQTGQLQEARELHEYLLEAKLTVQGSNSASTIGHLHNLAMTCWRMGDRDAATQHLQKAVDGRVRVYGSADPRTLESSYQLARMLILMEEYERGEKLLDRRLAPEIADDLAERGGSVQWVHWLCAYAQMKAKVDDIPRANELLAVAQAIGERHSESDQPPIKYLSETRTLLSELSDKS